MAMSVLKLFTQEKKRHASYMDGARQSRTQNDKIQTVFPEGLTSYFWNLKGSSPKYSRANQLPLVKTMVPSELRF